MRIFKHNFQVLTEHNLKWNSLAVRNASCVARFITPFYHTHNISFNFVESVDLSTTVIRQRPVMVLIGCVSRYTFLFTCCQETSAAPWIPQALPRSRRRLERNLQIAFWSISTLRPRLPINYDQMSDLCVTDTHSYQYLLFLPRPAIWGSPWGPGCGFMRWRCVPTPSVSQWSCQNDGSGA